jgi:ABC-type Fe3+/spermidine/putrescine transport system ATPase subunit
MLKADTITKSYPTPRGDLSILTGASLTLNRGDAVAIMGPSGSGKSTLLYILGALESPTSGTVALDGIDPFALGEREQAAFRNKHIGFVFQDHSLLPQCSVLENVLTPTLAAPPGEGSAKDDESRAFAARAGRSRRPPRPSSGRAVGGREAACRRRARAHPQPDAAPGRRADRQPRSRGRGRRRVAPAGPPRRQPDHPRRRDPQRRAGRAVPGQVRDGEREAGERGNSQPPIPKSQTALT